MVASLSASRSTFQHAGVAERLIGVQRVSVVGSRILEEPRRRLIGFVHCILRFGELIDIGALLIRFRRLLGGSLRFGPSRVHLFVGWRGIRGGVRPVGGFLRLRACRRLVLSLRGFVHACGRNGRTARWPLHPAHLLPCFPYCVMTND